MEKLTKKALRFALLHILKINWEHKSIRYMLFYFPVFSFSDMCTHKI